MNVSKTKSEDTLCSTGTFRVQLQTNILKKHVRLTLTVWDRSVPGQLISLP